MMSLTFAIIMMLLTRTQTNLEKNLDCLVVKMFVYFGQVIICMYLYVPFFISKYLYIILMKPFFSCLVSNLMSECMSECVCVWLFC